MRVGKKRITKKLSGLSNVTIILLARQYYQALMPVKKSHRTAVWVAFLLSAAMIAGQMLYPPDKAVLFARVNERPVGLHAHDDVAKLLTEQFDKTKIKLVVDGGKSVEYSLKAAGAEPNTERMIAELSDYPFWQRFIPFSLLWQVRQVSEVDVYYADPVLQQFSKKRSQDLSFAAANARLAIKDGNLVATREKSGKTVTSGQVYKALTEAPLQLGESTVITVQAKQVQAEHSMAEFAQVKTQAEAALARKVTIKADGRIFTPDTAEAATWLVLDTAADGAVTLRADMSRIEAYVATINKQVETPAGQTNITIVDGRETGRTEGEAGRAIDAGNLANQLATFLLEGKGANPLAVQFTAVPPSVIFNSRYTATQEGLQAYLNDLGRNKNVRVMMQQLDGGRWAASTRATESTPSGSTYKLYVALMLFDKMKKGEVTWNDPMLDTTVSTCFDRMTIASTNPCAEKWVAEWSPETLNGFIYAHGFSGGTTFAHSLAKHTTAADLTKYMIGLNDGSVVSEPYRSRLLHSLSVHPYRYGIPTGSKGRVWDKVGFLWDYIHDTAIVQHPRGTYILTIMTKGQSYAAIANITREIEKIMYP